LPSKYFRKSIIKSQGGNDLIKSLIKARFFFVAKRFEAKPLLKSEGK